MSGEQTRLVRWRLVRWLALLLLAPAAVRAAEPLMLELGAPAAGGGRAPRRNGAHRQRADTDRLSGDGGHY